MKKIIGFALADGVVDRLEIRIDGELPKFGREDWEDWEERARVYYEMEGDRFVGELLGHAPHGLVDQIFVALALHKASVLRPPAKVPGAECGKSPKGGR